MSNATQTDSLRRYIFENLDCRGELVQLSDTLDSIFANHQYPQPVKNLLAQMMATTALLTATLKFEGDISVQLQGDGPVSYAVINGNDKLQLRGMARVQGEVSGENLSALLGKAHMVITITPDKGERYQGIVPVESETVAGCLELYFHQSEQLSTRVWLATEITEQHNKVGGLFLQVLPVNKLAAEEDFKHLTAITNTIKDEELLHLDSMTLLTRLYHEDNPKVFEPQQLSFVCGCSREKTETALIGMSFDSLLEQAQEEGSINVDCQFCLQRYAFTPADITQLFNTH